MFRLFRTFEKEEYAKQFLKGKLYMSSLERFWWNLEGMRNTDELDPMVDTRRFNRDLRYDCMEGASIAMDSQEVARMVPDFKDRVAFETRLIPAGYAFCDVLCFTRQRVSSADGVLFAETPNLGDSLGDWIVVIDDFELFMRRITSGFNRNGWKFAAGPIQYEKPKPTAGHGENSHHIMLRSDPIPWSELYPGKEPSFEADAFVKSAVYQNQAEWRICLYRGESVRHEATTVKVGSLRDAAHIVHREEFDSDILNLRSNRKPWVSDAFHGNTSREELQALFLALGDNEVIMPVAMG